MLVFTMDTFLLDLVNLVKLYVVYVEDPVPLGILLLKSTFCKKKKTHMKGLSAYVFRFCL